MCICSSIGTVRLLLHHHPNPSILHANNDNIYNKDFYYKQNYNPADFEKFHQDKNKIQNIKIEKGALLLNKEKKAIRNFQKSNYLFIHEISPLLCYQPIFGYDLESLPFDKITFNEINKINDNLFFYEGSPKLINNDELNFFNPSCFVFPNENHCSYHFKLQKV